MKICRFDENRLGIVEAGLVHDVTPALDVLPAARWPLPLGDLLIVHLDEIRARIAALAGDAPHALVGALRLRSPGPRLTTKDEIPDPHSLDFSLTVNGELRQKSNARQLDSDVPSIIALASSYYSLFPGDIITTGTPAGVGPVKPGDTMHVEFAGLGAMDVVVRAA